MGRWPLRALRARTSDASRATEPAAEWYERALLAARAHGAMPYLVDGFIEVNEAVRRGHSVLLLREAADVAEGVRVFDEPASASSGPRGLAGSAHVSTPSSSNQMVTVVRFDPATARFVLRDVRSAVGGTELTPKRLERYMREPGRSMGVALGA